jgi:hypothetical protein
MTGRDFAAGLSSGFRQVRPARVLVLLLIAIMVALASDWLRDERVIFPAPLPKFTTVPAAR